MEIIALLILGIVAANARDAFDLFVAIAGSILIILFSPFGD